MIFQHGSILGALGGPCLGLWALPGLGAPWGLGGEGVEVKLSGVRAQRAPQGLRF